MSFSLLGPYLDPAGNPLSGGTIVIRLNQDASDGTNQYCASRETILTLDGSGSASGTLPHVSSLFPPGTTYIVTAYTAKGQPVFGPESIAY